MMSGTEFFNSIYSFYLKNILLHKIALLTDDLEAFDCRIDP